MYREHEKHVIVWLLAGVQGTSYFAVLTTASLLTCVKACSLFLFFFSPPPPSFLLYGIIARRGGLSRAYEMALRSRSVGTRAAKDAAWQRRANGASAAGAGFGTLETYMYSMYDSTHLGGCRAIPLCIPCTWMRSKVDQLIDAEP